MTTVVLHNYEICAHYKQGDDLGELIRKRKPHIESYADELAEKLSSPGIFVKEYIDPTPALEEWAINLKRTGEELLKLVGYIRANNIKIDISADTHMIQLEGEEEDLEKLVEACDVVQRFDMEVDEEDLY